MERTKISKTIILKGIEGLQLCDLKLTAELNQWDAGIKYKSTLMWVSIVHIMYEPVEVWPDDFQCEHGDCLILSHGAGEI